MIGCAVPTARHARAVLALIGAMMPVAVGAQDEAGDRPLVTSVQARGATSIDREQLLRGLVTKATSCRNFLFTPMCMVSRSPVFAERRYLDRAELRRDALRIRLYYWRRGFRDVAVTARAEPDGERVRVIFDITENPPTVIERLAIEQTDSVLPAALIAEAVTVREGEPLDLVALDSSLAILHRAFWERGYADALVRLDTSAVDNARNAGPVRVELEPGRLTTVAQINISGAREVSNRTIRHLLRFSEGDLYRLSSVLQGQRELYLSGLFSQVDVVAEPTTDSAKVVAVRVTEAPLHRVEAATGFTTADFLQLDATFTRYNFLGGARRVSVRGTVSNLLARQLNGTGVLYDVTGRAQGDERDRFLRPTWSASIDFTQPWFFGAGNRLSSSLFTHRRSVPGVVTDVGAGGTVSLTRDLGLTGHATVGYTYEVSRIDASDVYFCVSVGLCLTSTIDVVSRRHPLAPAAFLLQLDRTDDPLTPTRGVLGRLDLEHASRSTGSEYEYNRATLTASTYRQVGARSVLAGRVRLGIVRALPGTNRALGLTDDTTTLVIHPRKQFFSGGSRSVRGYGENQLGPRVLTIDPAKLTSADLPSPCTLDRVADGSCDPNQPGIRTRDFQPRPLGGTSLAEASIEYRFPLGWLEGLGGAVFVDGAIVGTRRFTDIVGTTAAITPGFGVRFATPVGPVRLDLGIRPRLVEHLPVITQVADSAGALQLVTLDTKRRFDPADTGGGRLRRVLNRLTLHLAIGPAF
jgi:outer membrane protein assembly factor BamA